MESNNGNNPCEVIQAFKIILGVDMKTNELVWSLKDLREGGENDGKQEN